MPKFKPCALAPLARTSVPVLAGLLAVACSTSTTGSGAASSSSSSGSTSSGSTSSGGVSGSGASSSGNASSASSFSVGSSSSSGVLPCTEDMYEPNNDLAGATRITLTPPLTRLENLATCPPTMRSLPLPGEGGTGLVPDTGSGSSGPAASSGTEASSAAGASSTGAASSAVPVPSSSSSMAPSSSVTGEGSSAMGPSSGGPAAVCTALSTVGSGGGSSSGGLPMVTAQPLDDWYRVTVPAHVALTLDLLFTHARSDLDLFVTDGTGRRLAGSSGTMDNEHVELPTSPVERDVVLVVRNYGNRGNTYVLEIRTADPAPPPPNDTCAAAATLVAGMTVSGDTTLATDDFQVAPGACGTFTTGGPDVFYAVNVEPGQTITATLTSATNHGLVLLEGCEMPCCWAAEDRYLYGRPEVLTFTNPTATALPLLLVVDAQHAGTFELLLEAP